MLGYSFLPIIIEHIGLHKEVVKKEIRKLRQLGVISTTRVPSYEGSTGTTLRCTYNGDK